MFIFKPRFRPKIKLYCIAFNRPYLEGLPRVWTKMTGQFFPVHAFEKKTYQDCRMQGAVIPGVLLVHLPHISRLPLKKWHGKKLQGQQVGTTRYFRAKVSNKSRRGLCMSRSCPLDENVRPKLQLWYWWGMGPGWWAPGLWADGEELGRVSRKPWKLFGPVTPFCVHLYLKTEKCISLKLLVWSEPLFILKICE